MTLEYIFSTFRVTKVKCACRSMIVISRKNTQNDWAVSQKSLFSLTGYFPLKEHMTKIVTQTWVFGMIFSGKWSEPVTSRETNKQTTVGVCGQWYN